MKGGDATDLEKLYRVYFMRVFSYMMTLAKDPDIAEELTQQTFFKAMSGGYRGEADELTYLCAIAKNLFYDELRRKKRFTAKSEEHSADIPDKADDPQTAAEEKDAVLQIHLAVHALSEPYKEVFSLRHAGVEPKSVFTGIFPPILRQPRSTYASMPSFGFLVLTKICSVKTAMHLTARNFGDSFVPCDAGRLAPVKEQGAKIAQKNRREAARVRFPHA